MTLYRSKPTEIEAIQWTGDNEEEIGQFLDSVPMTLGATLSWGPGGAPHLELIAGRHGAQGHVPVPVGHWIVRQPGDLDDHWPVDPEYFADKYEEVQP